MGLKSRSIVPGSRREWKKHVLKDKQSAKRGTNIVTDAERPSLQLWKLQWPIKRIHLWWNSKSNYDGSFALSRKQHQVVVVIHIRQCPCKPIDLLFNLMWLVWCKVHGRHITKSIINKATHKEPIYPTTLFIQLTSYVCIPIFGCVEDSKSDLKILASTTWNSFMPIGQCILR